MEECNVCQDDGCTGSSLQIIENACFDSLQWGCPTACRLQAILGYLPFFLKPFTRSNYLKSHHTREFNPPLPTIRASSPQPRGRILRKWQVIGLIWLPEVIPRIIKKYDFRFSFPVERIFQVQLPVWADSTKSCGI